MESQAFILDFNLLKEHNISAEAFLLLIQISNNLKIDNSLGNAELNTLSNNLFIRRESDEIIIREKGKLLLELTSIESSNIKECKKSIKKSSRLISEEVNSFIKEYRLLWKGLKLGSMGSEDSCKEKMTEWMSKNTSHSKEDILKAAKLYLNDLNNLTYLQRADYFIYKKEDGIVNSRLSAFIDEIDNKQVTDWTTKLN